MGVLVSQVVIARVNFETRTKKVDYRGSRLAWMASRIVALILALVLFAVGFWYFYQMNIYAICNWCHYVSCLKFFKWCR